MASCCLCQTKTLKTRVNISSAELAGIEAELRSESGPFVVSPERAGELEAILALADEDIREHDSGIARIQSELLVIQAQKQRLEAQRAKLHALLSPVRRLSNEILLNVFQYVCERNILQSYPLLAHEKHHTKLTSPVITYLPAMAISSVCSRWRELALSSPILWANLAVEMFPTAQAQIQAGFEGTVIRYMERSGDWPLSLALAIRGQRSKKELPSLIHLTRHTQRWKTFRYRGELSELSVLSESEFPSLVELDLILIKSPDLDRFKHSPRLSTLSTDLVPTSKVMCNLLEHLNFITRSPSLIELAEALHICPSVKSLTLEPRIGWFKDSSAQGTWRNITTLVIKEYFDDLCSEMVFSSFNFPSLNALDMNGSRNSKKLITWPGDAFISFVSRSSCVLTTFTLCGLSLSDSDLIAALRVMPSLLYLNINDGARNNPLTQQSPITSHLISSFQPQSTSIPLVPNLHSLRLTSRFNQTFDDHNFVRMVQSRWFKPGSALSAAMLAVGRASIRSVVLRFRQREVDGEIYEPLRRLDEAGLRVVISGSNGVQV